MAFDVLIRGGQVVNGNGATPAYPAAVGIAGDLAGATAAEVADATGGRRPVLRRAVAAGVNPSDTAWYYEPCVSDRPIAETARMSAPA